MINVVCLKHGTKYSADYVNHLAKMIGRHLTLPYSFYCFTEDTTGLDKSINVKPIPDNKFKGWWWKPYIFKKGHFDTGSINFYIDLDMVIIKNIDHFMTHLPGTFMGLRDPGRVFRTNYQMLGSAVMRWPNGEYQDIWDRLESSPGLTSKYHGDQNYIYNLHQDNIVFYPDDWIRSYKWEVRTRNELLGDSSGFKEIRDPIIHQETAILAFHGRPMVHTVKDPVIINNWC